MYLCMYLFKVADHSTTIHKFFLVVGLIWFQYSFCSRRWTTIENVTYKNFAHKENIFIKSSAVVKKLL